MPTLRPQRTFSDPKTAGDIRNMKSNDAVSHLVVLTTLGSAADARSLVSRLVESRVVACGTVLDPAKSIYRWQGNVEEADEALVILKTRRDRWDSLQSAVRELHPYRVPELLALPVHAGLQAYLSWLDRETVPAEEGV